MSNPEISVIIRTYNSGEFVNDAIGSVISQTINPEAYEIVVVDDGSTDNTLDVLKEFGGKIRLVRQEHKGPINAINTGIINSTGTFVILLDADDMFSPNALEELFGVLEAEEDIDFVYSDYYEESVNRDKKEHISVNNNLFNNIAGNIMFRKRILEEVGMYDENFLFAEYDLYMRLLKKKYRGKYLPLPLYVYRRTEGSITNSDRLKLAYEQLRTKYSDLKIRNY